ncbi:MAG TPA: GNAT family N-acetyltransferase [Stellaceae bacterium]|nr:GNAT family N-acetyltransferase [Stellaceae bacterium]
MPHDIAIQRLTALPPEMAEMAAEARAEGYGFLDRLMRDWSAGAMRFAETGEALWAARRDRVLAGIGGLTLDPVIPGALRMRRFYIRRSFRGIGVGRVLVRTLLDAAPPTAATITVNAARGSERFWEACGFVPDLRDGHTHVRGR